MPVDWLLPPREISNRRSAAGNHFVILIAVIASVGEAIQCHQQQTPRLVWSGASAALSPVAEAAGRPEY
jgi:hypothetical protein